MTLFKVRKSCAPLTPHSLIWDHLYPVTRLGQQSGDGPDAVDVPQLALHTSQGIVVTTFLSIEPLRFPLQSPLDPVLTCIGRQALTHQGFQTHWLPSHGLASQSKPLSRVWPLLHANIYEELNVRAWCQVGGPKMDKPPQGCNMSLHQRCYPILTPQTPLTILQNYDKTIKIQGSTNCSTYCIGDSSS